MEIPRGCRNKYEFDPDHGVIRLDRTLFTATKFPADYGFIRHTASEDGDPLDTMALLQEPTFPGCWIVVRAVGGFLDARRSGDRPEAAVRPGARSVVGARPGTSTTPAVLLAEIRHFLHGYKQLEPGTFTRCYGREGVEVADAVVRAAQRRARRAATTGTKP